MDRLELIENRLHTSLARNGEGANWPRRAIWIVTWASVTGILLGLLAFPFKHYSITAIGGLTAVVGAAVFLFLRYIARFRSGNLDTTRKRLLYVLLIAAQLFAARLCVEYEPARGWLFIPAPLFALLLTVVYNQRFALDHLAVLFALMAMQGALAAPVGVVTAEATASLLVLFSGSLATILLTRNLRSRVRLVKVGLYAGLIMAGAMVAFELMGFWKSEGGLFSLDMLKWVGIALAHGIAAGVIATSLIPILELAFGIVTEIRLLELEDGNHPLLKLMLERAPGTYMHTQNVARLASAGVEAIGGNALLTRVGTLFHDLGKMVRPEYFTENEPNSKLYHDRLTPQMSAMIILSHVKEGVEIARQHKLPRVLEDFITGHHGTSSVKYFYHKAKLQATNGTHVEESQFRYPGPKPQSREAAVLAIADLVEASGRAKLDGPQTPATMQKFVHDAIMMKLSDGQFNECDITMRDLKLAEDAMVKTLVSMYHHRIKYPDDPDARIKKLAMMEKEEYRKELAKRKEKILTQ